MANKPNISMNKNVTMTSDLVLRILVGLLFVCIGFGGMIGRNTNRLFQAVNNDLISVILGLVVLLSGLLLIVPIFLKGISATYVKISMIVVVAVWVIIMLLSDFYYGFKGTHGVEWFNWLENFIYHLLILSCIWKVSAGAFTK